MTRDRVQVEFPAHWNGLVGTYGGFVLATLADTARCVPGFDLLTLTTRLVAPTDEGTATVERTVVHRGSRTATIRLRAVQDGRTKADASAVLAPLDHSIAWERELPTASSPPVDWSDRPYRHMELAFLGNLELRTPPRFGRSDGSSAWIRLTKEPESLGLDSPYAIACVALDALQPVHFGEPPRPEFVPTVEFVVHFSPMVCRIGTDWVVGRNELEWTTDQYCVESATLSNPDGQLLAQLRQCRLIRWTKEAT